MSDLLFDSNISLISPLICAEVTKCEIWPELGL